MFHLIEAAIRARQMVVFQHEGNVRVAHPHLLGEAKRGPALLYWQADGSSSSDDLPGWRWAYLGEMQEFEASQEGFSVRADFKRTDRRFSRIYAAA